MFNESSDSDRDPTWQPLRPGCTHTGWTDQPMSCVASYPPQLLLPCPAGLFGVVGDGDGPPGREYPPESDPAPSELIKWGFVTIKWTKYRK